MSILNLKYAKNGSKVELELDIGERELDVVKIIVDKLAECATLGTIGSMKEMETFIAAGYNALKNDVDGLHSPGSEYSKQEGIDKLFKETASALETVEPSEVQEEEKTLNDKRQLWYICSCGNKGKHYILPHRKYITCHACPEKMMVRLATNAGPDHADEYGNHFIAGEFRKTMKSIEDEQKYWETYNESY